MQINEILSWVDIQRMKVSTLILQQCAQAYKDLSQMVAECDTAARAQTANTVMNLRETKWAPICRR